VTKGPRAGLAIAQAEPPRTVSVCRVAVSIKRKYNCRSSNACHSLPCPSPSRSCVLFPGIVSHAHAHGQSVVVLDTASYMYRNRVDSTHPLFDPGPRRLRHPQQPPLLGPVGVSQPHESMPSPARPCSQALHSRPPPTPPLTDEAHNKTSHLVHISFTRHVSSRLLTHVPRPSGVIRRHQASDQTESPSGVISHHQASSGVRPDGVAISRRAAAPTAAAIPTISTATAAFSSAAANAIARRSGVRVRLRH